MTWGKEQDDAVNDTLWRGAGCPSDWQPYKTTIDNSEIINSALTSWQAAQPLTRTCKITLDQTGIKCKLVDQASKKCRKASARSSISVTHAVAWALYYFSEAEWA